MTGRPAFAPSYDQLRTSAAVRRALHSLERPDRIALSMPGVAGPEVRARFAAALEAEGVTVHREEPS